MDASVYTFTCRVGPSGRTVVDVSTLSQLLAQHQGDLSQRDISRKARERGHTLSHAAVADAFKGKGRPDESTLLALSEVLSIPMAKLHEAVGVVTDDHDPYQPPPEAARLSTRQRNAVNELIRSMLEPIERPQRSAEGTVRSRSARKRVARE